MWCLRMWCLIVIVNIRFDSNSLTILFLWRVPDKAWIVDNDSINDNNHHNDTTTTNNNTNKNNNNDNNDNNDDNTCFGL